MLEILHFQGVLQVFGFSNFWTTEHFILKNLQQNHCAKIWKPKEPLRSEKFLGKKEETKYINNNHTNSPKKRKRGESNEIKNTHPPPNSSSLFSFVHSEWKNSMRCSDKRDRITSSVGNQWRSTQGAVEIEMLDPTFQALFVEHVSAIQLPHFFSGLECRQTHDAIGGVGGGVGVSVWEETIEFELVGEYGEVRESWGSGGRSYFFDGGGRGGEAEEERADVFEQSSEECDEHERDWIWWNVRELTL